MKCIRKQTTPIKAEGGGGNGGLGNRALNKDQLKVYRLFKEGKGITARSSGGGKPLGKKWNSKQIVPVR